MTTQALAVSLRVMCMAVPAIFLAGLPLAIFLARAKTPLRHAVEVLVLLPMLLPPTVVGYYLLFVLGRDSLLARWTHLRLLFTPAGAAVAAAVVGLPLMVLSSTAAIQSIDRRLERAARTLGAGELRILREITLPLARNGIIAGMLLGAVRAFGEFGATLMVAGSIPGKTRTLSIALYDAVQLGDARAAAGIVALLTAVTATAIVALRLLRYGGGLR